MYLRNGQNLFLPMLFSHSVCPDFKHKYKNVIYVEFKIFVMLMTIHKQILFFDSHAPHPQQNRPPGQQRSTDEEDTMKNLRRTFAGIFGDM